MTIGRLFS